MNIGVAEGVIPVLTVSPVASAKRDLGCQSAKAALCSPLTELDAENGFDEAIHWT